MNCRRVVITGMGVVSPLGCELGVFLDRLVKGQSGIRRIQTFDASGYTSQIAGEVVDFEVEKFIGKKSSVAWTRIVTTESALPRWPSPIPGWPLTKKTASASA